MHCIFTGFDPFNGAEKNPSQQTVARLPGEIQSREFKIKVLPLTLSTCCQESWQLLQETVAQVPEEQTFALIMCGLAESRKMVSLERFALNVRSYRIADNRGHQWQDEYLEPDAADAIRTSLPLPALERLLGEKGYLVEISNHAGSFVCNETYYRTLHKWQRDRRCAGILFVHVPLPSNYAAEAALDDADDQVLEIYAQLLAEIGIFIANQRKYIGDQEVAGLIR